MTTDSALKPTTDNWPAIYSEIDNRAKDYIDHIVIHEDDLGGACYSLAEICDTLNSDSWLHIFLPLIRKALESKICSWISLGKINREKLSTTQSHWLYVHDDEFPTRGKTVLNSIIHGTENSKEDVRNKFADNITLSYELIRSLNKKALLKSSAPLISILSDKQELLKVLKNQIPESTTIDFSKWLSCLQAKSSEASDASGYLEDIYNFELPTVEDNDIKVNGQNQKISEKIQLFICQREQKIKRQEEYKFKILRYLKMMGDAGGEKPGVLVTLPAWYPENLHSQSSIACVAYFPWQEKPEVMADNIVHVLTAMKIGSGIFSLLALQRSSELIRQYAIRSALVVIMSRNGSHNIGSHVINRVVENIDTLNIQDHRFFLRYLQQRMDFLAQISTDTDFSRPASSHWFVKEVMKGFYEQRHLLSYIARSEGLKGYDGTKTNNNGDREQLQCIIKRVKRYECRESSCTSGHTCSNSCTHAPDRKANPIIICDVTGEGETCHADLGHDLMIAIPGGTIGFHALYTILENFTRNTAKHCYANHPTKGRDMKIRLEIWDFIADPEYYTIQIWDDYSYISGLVDMDTIPCGAGNELSDYAKIILFLPAADTSMTIVSSSNHDVPEPLISAKDLNIEALEEELNSDENSICYIIDDGNTLHRYGILSKLNTVRFVEKSYWDQFCKQHKTDKSTIDAATLIEFLARYLIPSHCLINEKIMDSLVSESGELKKSNWGIGEMKITAGYLAGRTLADIGGNGKDNLSKLVRAVAIPEYRRDVHSISPIAAYRLGYEFRIKRPIDLLVLGYPCEKEAKVAARNNGILFLTDNKEIDRGNTNARMVVLCDSEVPHPLITALKTELEPQATTPENRIRIQQLLAEFGRFSIMIASDELAEKAEGKGNKIDPFIRKRVVFLRLNEIKELIASKKENIWDALKCSLYGKWISHLVHKVREIGKVKLYFAPKGTDSSGKTDNTFLSKAVLAGMLQNYHVTREGNSAKKEYAEYLAVSEKIWQASVEKVYLTCPEDQRQYVQPRNIIEQIPKAISESNEIKCWSDKNNFRDNFKNEWTENKNCMSEIPNMVKGAYGIFDTAYIPSTVPYILQGEGTTEEHILLETWDFINIIASLPEQPDSTTIIYERHMPAARKNIGSKFLYAEDLSGAAPHFPQIASPPATNGGKFNQNLFTGQLIETALLRIAVADERVYEAVVRNGRGRDELQNAKICFIRKILNYEITKQPDDKSHEISYEGDELTMPEVEILILHQGILDKLDRSLITGDGDKIAQFISQIKKKIPYVVITSGRGEPADLPDHVAFIAFSVIEATLLSRPHSKYNLIRQII